MEKKIILFLIISVILIVGCGNSVENTAMNQSRLDARLKPVGKLENFFAPPRPTGNIEVALTPTEVVQTGQPTLITFGLPLPKGSMRRDGLGTVRAMIDGQPVPIYVDAMAMWRTLTSDSDDNTWVRIVRIQLEYAFAESFPARKTMRVLWGGQGSGPRRAEFIDPHSAWHLVDSDTFPAECNTWEPDVYVILPVDIGCDGVIKMQRMKPAVSMSEELDNAADILSRDFSGGYAAYDYAMKNFCYTLLNRGGEHVLPENRWNYSNCDNQATDTDRSNWLYDRASAMFLAHGRTGFFFFLREAVRLASFYREKVMDDGFFAFRPGDERNQLTESQVYAAWLTGAPHMIDKIERMAEASVSIREMRWHPYSPFWTERHPGLVLLTNMMAYEALGGDMLRQRCITMAENFLEHQDGRDGLLPDERVGGGLFHYGQQHDPSEFHLQTSLTASPWMSILVCDAMLRVYAMSESRDVASFIDRFGIFFKTTSKTDNKHRYEKYKGEDGVRLPLTYPDYLMREDGSSIRRENMEHDINVAGMIAYADYFHRQLYGVPGDGYLDCAERLYHTYSVSTNIHWTDPDNPKRGLPEFVMSPWRRYGWQYRSSMSFTWLMPQLGGKGGYPPSAAVPQYAVAEPVADEDANGIIVREYLAEQTLVRLWGRRGGEFPKERGPFNNWASLEFRGGASGIPNHNRVLFTPVPNQPESEIQPIGLWEMRLTDVLEIYLKVDAPLPPEGGYLHVGFNGDWYADAPQIVAHITKSGEWQRFRLNLTPLRNRLDGAVTMIDFVPGKGLERTGTVTQLSVAGIRIMRPSPRNYQARTRLSENAVFNY